MLYITVFLSGMLIVLVASVLAPMGVRFSSVMYTAGETLLLESNETIASIQNDEVRTQLLSVLDAALDSQATNIEVNADIFQYGWVIAILLVGLVSFIFTRQTIEASGRGGFV